MPAPLIHATAAPNGLSCEALRLRSGAAPGGLAVDPERAGWRYLSFRSAWLEPGESIELDPRQEHAVVLIRGGDAQVVSGSPVSLRLTGRASPFDALPSACYVPTAVPSLVVGGGTLVAIASATPSPGASASAASIAIGPSDIRVEVRGAGNATRQINHIISPEFAADRLEIVEVLTPSGNWSSWPPHKHDIDDWPSEAVLEEVYFYQFRRPEAWGHQRLYRSDRSRDCAWEVRTGDVVLVTDGYHPFVAAHGDDAYYLNALAGDRRTMACSFDSDYDWVRAEWPSLIPDPRVPLTGLPSSAAASTQIATAPSRSSRS
jgi:5-deoxy-glucuronate isomerase